MADELISGGGLGGPCLPLVNNGDGYVVEQDLAGNGAAFSRCGRYRYGLTRVFSGSEGAGPVCFVMLNPSTADAFSDDATIRRCVGYARRWGHSRLDVVNLFAWRSTDPSALMRADDPVGLQNDVWIRSVCLLASRVVVAWGNGGALRCRGSAVAEMLWALGLRLWCFRISGQGQPEHPLYQPKRAVLVEYVKPETGKR